MNKLGKWSLSSLNGILLMIFGVVALLLPSLTIVFLAIYFAISILIGGAILTLYAFKFKETLPGWKVVLIEGLIGILLGIAILLMPESAAALLVLIVGLWAFFLGLVFVLSYFRNNMPSMLKDFHLITGIVSGALGLIIILNPFESTRVIMVLIGIYAIAYGVFSIINSNKRISIK